MVREMQTRGTLANGDSISYARGLFIGHYRGLRRVEHGGDWVGYHAAYSRFPDQHTSVMILCNSDGISPTELADKVSDIVLAKSFTEKAPGIAAAGGEKRGASGGAQALDASRLTGSYYASSNDEVVRVVKKDTALVLEFVGRSFPLHAIAPATYATSGLPVTVEFVADGEAPARAVRLFVASELRAEAVRFAATTPDQAALRQFAGSYYSPELGVTWPMAVDGDHLVLRNEGSELVDISGALSPAMEDAFTAGGGMIRFTRDALGNVTGYELSASRMRGIRFEREKPNL